MLWWVSKLILIGWHSQPIRSRFEAFHPIRERANRQASIWKPDLLFITGWERPRIVAGPFSIGSETPINPISLSVNGWLFITGFLRRVFRLTWAKMRPPVAWARQPIKIRAENSAWSTVELMRNIPFSTLILNWKYLRFDYPDLCPDSFPV